MDDFKHLSSEMDNIEFDVETLNDSSYSQNQARMYFAIHLSKFILGSSDLAKRLGFMTKEEARRRYPKQGATPLRIPFALALAMGLIKIIQITLTPQDPEKIHPCYGNG